MSTTFDLLQTLDATPNWSLINTFNAYFAIKNPKYKLIVNDRVRPCFFSGDLEVPGKIITVSLNPSYTPGVTEARQTGMDFAAWYNYCRFRFTNYQSESEISTVFKNLFKVIVPPTMWTTANKRQYLQTHLLNLDWCCYYSEKFPSITLNKLPSYLQEAIAATWDTTLSLLVETAQPRYIFIHGRPLRAWMIRNTTNLQSVMQLKNSRGQRCALWKGRFLNTVIPVYYLEHFINGVNQNSTLARIHKYIEQS